MRRHLTFCFALSFVLAAWSANAQSTTPDMVLVNGKILTVDRDFSVVQALAITGDTITAMGSAEDIRRLAGPGTQVVDLEGRTVIPGLIDSHIHAIRAGLTFSMELNWIGLSSLEQAIETVRHAAASSPPGTWITVAGGWERNQFRERRGPTQAELVAAAPNHPVYIQHLYEYAVLTPKAMEELKIAPDSKIPPAGKVETDPSGKPTGIIRGNVPTFAGLFNRIPKPTLAQQTEGTRLYFRELNRVGLTGVNDVAGGGLFPAQYQPVLTLWRNKQLTIRIAYHVMSQNRDKELDDFKIYTQFLTRGFGDGMMKFLGLGEAVIWGMHDGDSHGIPFKGTEQSMQLLYETAKFAAERGLVLHIHASSDNSGRQILDVFERVNAEVPITGLRWVIAHLEDMTEETMQRMKKLGMGLSVQNRLHLQGDTFLKVMGPEAARRAPPIMTARKHGLVIAAGTDSHRIASYSPFISLRWMLDGKSVSGAQLRGPEESPGREEALRMYTVGSAWMAHDDDKRGSLEPGKWADLVVLNKDYMTAPVDEIGEITSLLTLVGGRAVYADGPFAALERK